jgi:hypothetical protein
MKDRMIAKAALEMFDQFDVIRDTIDHCREGDIEVTTSIFMHYGKTGLSAGCYRVAITNGPEELEEVRMGGSRKLEIPLPLADTIVSEEALNWLKKAWVFPETAIMSRAPRSRNRVVTLP